jgi:hypothetical protein
MTNAIIPTAAEWMGALGYHVSTDSGDYSHPLCHEENLADAIRGHASDSSALDSLVADGLVSMHNVPRGAAIDLIAYARRGLRAGQAIHAALCSAVKMHELGQLNACAQGLREAAMTEAEWGDTPSTDAVAMELGMVPLGPDHRYGVHCECGSATGVCCEWSGAPSDTVVVEWMPTHLRESHRAAGNWGIYPMNGALRLRVHPDCAAMIADNEDES